eukprot:Skav220831  [mRNA]  locus=scaffold1888:74950:83964:+ [translate_table: standard]
MKGTAACVESVIQAVTRRDGSLDRACLDLDAPALTKCIGNLGRLQQPRAAVSVLEAVERASGEVNVFHYNAAISACASEFAWPLALYLFQKARSIMDIVSYGALIHVYSKAQRWEESLHLLKDALKQELQVNSIIFTSSLGSLGQKWRTSLELIGHMRSQMDLTAPAITSAITCCPWTHALELLDLGSLGSGGDMSSGSTHNAALVATMGFDWSKGLGLLQSMSFKRVAEDQATVSSAIAGLGSAGHWTLAMHLLESASRENQRLDAITFGVFRDCDQSTWLFWAVGSADCGADFGAGKQLS